MFTVCLVDLSAIFWRRWNASTEDIDKPFELTMGAVILASYMHDYIIVCLDEGRSFRYDLDKSYKANRPPKDAEAVRQLNFVVDSLKRRGFAIAGMNGFEGDDVIASLCRQAIELTDDLEIIMYGEDKDLLQRICPRVSMLNAKTNITTWVGCGCDPRKDCKYCSSTGRTTVERDYGISPIQFIDYLSLVGDSADNIKGVKGIGTKSAVSLLQKFGTIENIFDALNYEDDEGPLVYPKVVHRVLSESSLDVALYMRSLVVLEDKLDINLFELLRIDARRRNRQTMTLSKNTFSSAKVSTKRTNSANINIVLGKSGVGKTHFCSTIPKVFWLPTERGLDGCAPGTNPPHFATDDGIEILPTNVAEFCDAVDAFLSMDGYTGLVVDSLSGIEVLVHRAAMGSEKADHMEAIEYKKVWHAAESHWRRIQDKLNQVRLRGIDVWIIAHACEVTETSSVEGAFFKKWDLFLKGSGDAGVAVRQFWRQFANNVFFLDWQTTAHRGKRGHAQQVETLGRVIIVQEDATHYAKNRWGLVDPVPATYGDLISARNAASEQIPPEKLGEFKIKLGKYARDKLKAEDVAKVTKDLEEATTVGDLRVVRGRIESMIASYSEDKQSSEDKQES